MSEGAIIALQWPNGQVANYPKGMTLAAILEQKNEKTDDVLGALVDGHLTDLQTGLQYGGAVKLVRLGDAEALEFIRHTAAHVMAQAVKDLFPDAVFAIGPVIEDGFYYDFDVEKPFQPEDLPKIEKAMQKIVERNFPVIRRTLARAEALAFFKNDKYKTELIENLPADAEISTYSQDVFTDLCRGPHAVSTGLVKAFKLQKIAGAYWRGDERNKMLQRIYGTAWRTQEELDEYLRKLEEAQKRDHRKLGRELDLFSIHEEVGPGLVLWHPRGAIMRKVIEDYWRDQHLKNGYQLIFTPHVGRATLWQTSGHLDFYKENMYPAMELEEETYFVKPMNCPFHIRIFTSKTRSYREMPMRMAELGTVYRFERSGVLHGLLRVRGFTQDDAHIYCRPEQIVEELVRTLRFCLAVLGKFGFTNFAAYIATRPKVKCVGEEKDWRVAEEALREAARQVGLTFETDEGGGAFYGPKIDIKIKDALGREWQCSTVQFDFNLSERFQLEYIDADGKPKRPYMIHRALMGSLERFFGCLIEHYAGSFPAWLAPVQARVLTVSDKTEDYAREIADKLTAAGYRVETDLGSDKIGKKIREAEVLKVPFMLVVGEKDRAAGKVSVREHGKGDLGGMTLEEFQKLLVERCN